MIDMFDTSKTFSEIDFAEAKRLEDEESIKIVVKEIYLMFRDSFLDMTETYTCRFDLSKLRGLVKKLFSSYLVTDIVNMYYRNQMRSMSERAWDGSQSITLEVHETLLFLGAMREISDMATKPNWEPKGKQIHRTGGLNGPDEYAMVLPYMDAVRFFKVLSFLTRQISLLTSYEMLAKVSNEKREGEEAGDTALFEEMDRI